MHHVYEVYQDSDHVQTDLLAGIARQQHEQLIQYSREKRDDGDQLNRVCRLQYLTGFRVRGCGRRFCVQDALGVDEEIVQMKVTREHRRNQLERHGEDRPLRIDPSDIRSSVLQEYAEIPEHITFVASRVEIKRF